LVLCSIDGSWHHDYRNESIGFVQIKGGLIQ